MLSAATWMDLEIIILSEVNQTKGNITCYPLYVESKKKWYIWTYLQNRRRLTDLREWTYGYQQGRAGESDIREFRINMYIMVYLKSMTDNDALYSTGNLLNAMWQPGQDGSLGEKGYMYGWVVSLCIWNYHNIVNQLYSNIKEKAEKRLQILIKINK